MEGLLPVLILLSIVLYFILRENKKRVLNDVPEEIREEVLSKLSAFSTSHKLSYVYISKMFFPIYLTIHFILVFMWFMTFSSRINVAMFYFTIWLSLDFSVFYIIKSDKEKILSDYKGLPSFKDYGKTLNVYLTSYFIKYWVVFGVLFNQIISLFREKRPNANK